MGWTAGADVTTGDLITAAKWNTYLGVTGSIDYLKTEADKHDDCSSTSPGRAIDTIYQNGSKTRVVMITVKAHNTSDCVEYLIGSSSPPTTIAGLLRFASGEAGEVDIPGTFIVPPAWYYKLLDFSGSPTLRYWHEWDLM